MSLRPVMITLSSFLAMSSGCLVGVEEGAGDGTDDGAEVGADATAAMDGSGDASGADSTGADATIGDPTETDGGDDGAPLSGEELFASMCAPCHGDEGQGTDLAYELRHPFREYATWVIRNGRTSIEFEGGTMVPYLPAAVSDAQLEEIFDWLDSFPQPETGEGLYMDYCRNCHGADPSTGGVVQQDELGEKTAGELLEKVREGEGGTDYGNRLLYMPAMDAQRLSDAEVMLIYEWLGA